MDKQKAAQRSRRSPGPLVPYPLAVVKYYEPSKREAVDIIQRWWCKQLPKVRLENVRFLRRQVVEIQRHWRRYIVMKSFLQRARKPKNLLSPALPTQQEGEKENLVATRLANKQESHMQEKRKPAVSHDDMVVPAVAKALRRGMAPGSEPPKPSKPLSTGPRITSGPAGQKTTKNLFVRVHNPDVRPSDTELDERIRKLKHLGDRLLGQ